MAPLGMIWWPDADMPPLEDQEEGEGQGGYDARTFKTGGGQRFRD